MRRKYKLEGIDCANCAMKMEQAIRNIDGIEKANIIFLTEKLILEHDEDVVADPLPVILEACRKIERDIEITPI